ncbi:hypothetical protein CBR_g31814 [Chara braunii]|uniref:Uncharacterized protein n=1 Tax=Chara braunii TaxID=69332 RepID=A0A388LFQ3_CHABU|nr:hypothetical protein CBR_g31814 [Chara braunii]|eukprot:GBG81138.1 hypothetical protein CBR_g31814 [Chara braunii]
MSESQPGLMDCLNDTNEYTSRCLPSSELEDKERWVGYVVVVALIFGGGIWLKCFGEWRCEGYLGDRVLMSDILLVAALLLMCVIGFVCKYCGNCCMRIAQIPLCSLFIVYVACFLALLYYTIFAFVVTQSRGAGSDWLRNRWNDGYWSAIGTCLYDDRNLCKLDKSPRSAYPEESIGLPTGQAQGGGRYPPPPPRAGAQTSAGLPHRPVQAGGRRLLAAFAPSSSSSSPSPAAAAEASTAAGSTGLLRPSDPVHRADDMSRLQRSCCAMPVGCADSLAADGSGVYYTKKKNGTARGSSSMPPPLTSDCDRFNNSDYKNPLCFGCDDCKEAFEANVKKAWRYFAIYKIVWLAVFAAPICAAILGREEAA